MSDQCRRAKISLVIFGKSFVSNRITRFGPRLGIWEQSGNVILVIDKPNLKAELLGRGLA